MLLIITMAAGLSLAAAAESEVDDFRDLLRTLLLTSLQRDLEVDYQWPIILRSSDDKLATYMANVRREMFGGIPSDKHSSVELLRETSRYNLLNVLEKLSRSEETTPVDFGATIRLWMLVRATDQELRIYQERETKRLLKGSGASRAQLSPREGKYSARDQDGLSGPVVKTTTISGRHTTVSTYTPAGDKMTEEMLIGGEVFSRDNYTSVYKETTFATNLEPIRVSLVFDSLGRMEFERFSDGGENRFFYEDGARASSEGLYLRSDATLGTQRTWYAYTPRGHLAAERTMSAGFDVLKRYEYLEFDSYGNWTSRRVSGEVLSGLEQVEPIQHIEQRVIVYKR